MRPGRQQLWTWGIAGSALAFAAAAAMPARAQQNLAEDVISAVVHIKTFINPDGRSVSSLGRERTGSGILIDANGLILTIGYLMVEAHAAEVVTNAGRTVPASVVGYDHETGFGLLRTLDPLKEKPLGLGTSADLKVQGRALVVSFGGPGMALPVNVVSRRLFAGSWEYMVADAIFTTPPHPEWSGAALIGHDGKLLGVGSLIVRNAPGDGDNVPGNMFVPIDLLKPILGDLLVNGRVSGPGKPWLGVNADELGGRLLVSRVTPESPAEKAGIRRGDIVAGIGGDSIRTLPEFYRKLWSLGPAGVNVPLDVIQHGETRRLDIPSVNRLDQLKLKSTF